ncbi:hypothetical protein [Pseudomonas sp. UBA6562]|uniref:hypothetical protein n=1 Tax=Pseudomonas sp. UBA6562 TaxID=1947332 RepID=UPI0025F1688E|nr:hypothetical protein [Pseudomonas sp. UBA6562]
MSYITQTVVLLVLGAILIQFLKPYSLRKWLGLALLAIGVIGIFKGGEQHLLGFDLGLLTVLAVPLGMTLFSTRRRFTEED